MNTGYVRLYRKVLESDVWELSLVARETFVWLLLSVNYKEKTTAQGVVVGPGEIITSYRKIAEGISPKSHPKVTPKQVRGAIDALSSVRVVSKLRSVDGQTGGQAYLHIKLLHWEDYQAVEGQTKGQGSGQTEGRPRAATKEGKKVISPSTNVEGKCDWVARWIDALKAAGKEPPQDGAKIFGRKVKEIANLDPAVMEDTIRAMVEQGVEPYRLTYKYGDCKQAAQRELERVNYGGRRGR